ncbi:hypothetical protein M413DRAFT_30170 [Hebeloma cylindrosporum]|uniref:Major facilitator superfamily (MFS) profile domain-containing protein n=1 Tax=Hebeloma cylindrosporum TaxID=76867 RepID=A0A0C3C215_HEBCY|nr:hypothetical protein M413DRAFT_30170 [Hebeloma cylindrosporum h7]
MSEKGHSSSPPLGSQEFGLTKGSDGISGIDEDLEKKAVRRVDYTVLPVMSMFYLLSFLDRGNIGNARVAGLQQDLKMTDAQYQICLTVLFVPYIASELPSNLILRKIGPSILMPTLLTVWGIIVTLQGLVTNFAGLLTVRVLLGLFEGPMAPCIVCYLSGFYTRKELSLRIALFFSAASLAGAFSGFLAAAIQKMDGVGGKAGWAWIFIIEGLFTVCMGLAGFFVIPSTPSHSKFLTSEQKKVLMARLERDRPSIKPSDKFSGGEILRSVRSPHVVIVFILFFLAGTGTFGLALFLPSIVSELGFSRTKTQLLSVGPFAAGFLVMVISAYLSDRYQSRGVATALVATLAVAGYSIYLGAQDKFVAYGALYLMVPGLSATTPILSTWLSNNSEPYYRRATSIALGFIAANSGGILSTWRFPTKEGPRYTETTIMFLTFSICVVLGSLLNVAYLSSKNKSKARVGRREELLEKYSEDEDGGLRAWMELGDEHPDFRYTL